MCGIPSILYTDNGSDFTSQHLEQVGADLKIRLVFSTAGKPGGRGRIERFFSTVNEMVLCALDVYHRRENAETKTTPVERWGAKSFLPRMPDSLEQLDLLLV